MVASSGTGRGFGLVVCEGCGVAGDIWVSCGTVANGGGSSAGALPMTSGKCFGRMGVDCGRGSGSGCGSTCRGGFGAAGGGDEGGGVVLIVRADAGPLLSARGALLCGGRVRSPFLIYWT